ncbi:MAG: tandem-95 repeat protein [Candidatus Thermoplasmatota archaeon]|nr:tandem-95 repeat protein [Euryarchaeota archaeon]MBU4031583.1 tandem-95 repeat protein [Candidatus Thermoplasmatota archaeon]MBU4071162.1 tandem-95 repeat protein [Candidatus Thermoplasmatota archaeon]MBU4145076.1 tandem-95 repeat protein [Candidatus Thermoplasmatota archaeon]MBU4591055.1 tandem-95 repeat protein [Candidatus Thermoplasmatota archaeon]
MNLKKTIKICASVLLAIVIVGMPYAIITVVTYGSTGGIVILPPEMDPIVPLPFNEPPTCIMDYDSIIHMTTATTFNLEDAINLDEYFKDGDGPMRLAYSVEYQENIADVDLKYNYLDSVTTFNENVESLITVWASDGMFRVPYNFTLKIENRETINIYEDNSETIDVRKYLPPTLETYYIETSNDVTANLDYENFVFAELEIIPTENWWGNDVVTLSLYDEPRFTFPIPPFQEKIRAIEELLYVYGYFEFDVDVSAVNDPPTAKNDESYELLITDKTAASLTNPIELNKLFEDIDSTLYYSWISEYGLAAINIREDGISSITSGSLIGDDIITLIANDGEYVATCNIPVSVLPRTSIEMFEDVSKTLELADYLEADTQDYQIISMGEITTAINPVSYRVPQVILSSDLDWFGSDVVSLSVYPKLFDINPPFDPNIIFSIPPEPIIPPMPTADYTYGFYEFDVNVAGVNDPPYVILEPTVTIMEDGALDNAFNVKNCFGDVDSVLEFTLDDSSASYVTATADLGGDVRISALSNWFGTDTVTITASDGEYETSQDISVRVLPVNDIPFATDTDAYLELEEDANITINLDNLISDIDDALWFSYACSDTNSTMALNETTWEMTVIPDENWNGIISMIVYGSDGESELARNLVLNVNAVNDRPEIIFMESLTMAEDSALELDLSTFITDLDSELEFTIFSSRGIMNCEMVQDSVWSIRAFNAYWNGNEMLRVFAYDGQYMVNLNLSLEVSAVNNAPMQRSQMSQISMQEDSAFSLAVGEMFSDVDGDILQYGFSNGEKLNLALDDETMILSITPDENWFGDSVVTVGAFDGAEWTFQEIPVEISAVNDPPYMIKAIPSAILTSGNSTVINLSGYFGDVDSVLLTMEILGTDNVTVSSVDRGVFKIQTMESWEGSETLTVHISDGENILESSMAVSAYVPAVEIQTASSGGNFFMEMSWMGVGMVVAITAYALYTATSERRTDTRTPTNKGRIL